MWMGRREQYRSVCNVDTLCCVVRVQYNGPQKHTSGIMEPVSIRQAFIDVLVGDLKGCQWTCCQQFDGRTSWIPSTQQIRRPREDSSCTVLPDGKENIACCGTRLLRLSGICVFNSRETKRQRLLLAGTCKHMQSMLLLVLQCTTIWHWLVFCYWMVITCRLPPLTNAHGNSK